MIILQVSLKVQDGVILGNCFLCTSGDYNMEFGDLVWTQLQWQKRVLLSFHGLVL